MTKLLYQLLARRRAWFRCFREVNHVDQEGSSAKTA